MSASKPTLPPYRPTDAELGLEPISGEELMGGSCPKRQDGGPHDAPPGYPYCRKCGEAIARPTATVELKLPVQEFPPTDGWLEMHRRPLAAHVRRFTVPVRVGDKTVPVGSYVAVSEDGKTADVYAAEALRAIYEPATPEAPEDYSWRALTPQQKAAAEQTLDELVTRGDAAHARTLQAIEAAFQERLTAIRADFAKSVEDLVRMTAGLRQLIRDAPTAEPLLACGLCGTVWPTKDQVRACAIGDVFPAFKVAPKATA
jgi:hypothetical protein